MIFLSESQASTMGQLASMSDRDALLNGLAAIALVEETDVSAASLALQAKQISDLIRSRVHGEQPQALLAQLHHVLFDEMVFTLSPAPHPAHNVFPTMVANKVGTSSLLAALYYLVADNLGMIVHGVSLPGVMLVHVAYGDDQMYVNPSAGGRIIDGRELESFCQNNNLPFNDDTLGAVSIMDWLTRMMQYSIQQYTAQKSHEKVATLLEMELAMYPGATLLNRDYGLVLVRLGRNDIARQVLGKYVQQKPDDAHVKRLYDSLA